MNEQAALNAQVIELEPQVRKLAEKLHRRGKFRCDIDDMVQVGLLAVVQCIQTFDTDYGVELWGYCYRRVQGAMIDSLGKHTGLSRAHTRRLVKLSKRIEAAESTMETHGADGSLADAEFVDVMLYNIRTASNLSQVESFEESTSDQVDGTLNPTERRITKQQEIARMRAAFSKLDLEEQFVLQQHYVQGLTLVDVGKSRDWSKSWVSRIHTRALARLRTILAPEIGARAR